MNIKYIWATLLASTWIAEGTATVTSNTDNNADSTKVFFNAIDYRLQKRYIPQGRTIDQHAKGKNWTIEGTAGLLKVRGGISEIAQGGFAISKEVSSFNTYRLSFLGGATNGYQMGAIEMAHLFNLTDYLRGYQPGHRMYLYTVAGLGGYLTKKDNTSKHAAAAIFGGLQMRYHLGSHWDWTIEPKVYVATDGMDGMDCPKKYDLGYGITTGLSYRLTRLPIQAKSENAGDNLFIEAGIGLQGDYASRTRKGVGMIGTLGPAASLSIGKWFMPIGFRLTGFGAMHHTLSPQNLKRKEAQGGIRMEGMLNLNTLLKPSVDDPKMEVNISGGYELGVLLHKSEAYSKSVRIFHGPTTALQLLYFINSQVGIFAEGRYSRNEYSQPYKNGSSYDYRLQNLSGMLGIQYRRRKEVYNRNNRFFKPYNYVYTNIGGNLPMRRIQFNISDLLKATGVEFAIGAGRQISTLSGFRVSLEIERWKDPKYKMTPFSISADYLLNLTNMIGGYNENRWFGLNAFAGIIYTHHNKLDKNYFGLEGGLQQEFHLKGPWSLTLEEGFRMYHGRITPSIKVFTSEQFSILATGTAGVKYRF